MVTSVQFLQGHPVKGVCNSDTAKCELNCAKSNAGIVEMCWLICPVNLELAV